MKKIFLILAINSMSCFILISIIIWLHSENNDLKKQVEAQDAQIQLLEAIQTSHYEDAIEGYENLSSLPPHPHSLVKTRSIIP